MLPKDQGPLLQLLVERNATARTRTSLSTGAKGSYDLVIHLEGAATFSCRPLRVNREPDLVTWQCGQDLLCVS